MNIQDIKKQAKELYKSNLRRSAGVEAISFTIKFAAIFTLLTIYVICLTKLGSPAASVPAALILLVVLAAIYLFVIAPVNLGRNLYFTKMARGYCPSTDEMFHFFKNIKSAVYAYFRIALAMIFYTVFFTAVAIVYFRIYSLFTNNWFTLINFILCAAIIVIYATCIVITRLKYAALPVVHEKNNRLSPLVFVAKTLRISQGLKSGLFALHLSFIGWYALGILTLGIGFIWISPYIRTASSLYLDKVIN